MRRGTAAVIGLVLAAARSTAPAHGQTSTPAALAESAPEHASAGALRGLATLDSGYPLMRWSHRASSIPPGTPGGDDRGGLWLRLGHDGEPESAVPGGGYRLRAGSARLGAPFPLFPMTGGDDFFAQLWLRLGTRIGIRTEYHVIELGAAESPWYGLNHVGRAPAADADQPVGRRELAHVVGVGFVLALSDAVAVEAQYGHALGPALADPSRAAGAAHYGYIELSVRY